MSEIKKIKFKLLIEVLGVQYYDQNVDYNNFCFWGDVYPDNVLNSTAFARKNFEFNKSGNQIPRYKISSNRLNDIIYRDYMPYPEVFKNLYLNEEALEDYLSRPVAKLRGYTSGGYSIQPTLIIGEAIEVYNPSEMSIDELNKRYMSIDELDKTTVFDYELNQKTGKEYKESVGKVLYLCHGYFDVKELVSRGLSQEEISNVVKLGLELLGSINYSGRFDFFGKSKQFETALVADGNIINDYYRIKSRADIDNFNCNYL